MRLSLFALALLLVLPASAGELIRYRTPDGGVGFVDDEKRLPGGVEVLSRTPLDPPAPKPAPPAPEAAGEPAANAAEPLAAGAAVASEEPAAGPALDCNRLANLLERTRCRSAQEARCSHYGLAPTCKPAEVADAEDWCERGETLRAEISTFDDERDAARERLDECLRRSAIRPDCGEDDLEEAERVARTGERRVEALEEQCHDQGCLPGWVREGCEFEPEG